MKSEGYTQIAEIAQLNSMQTQNDQLTLYQLLEVDPQADVQTIRQSYRRLVKKYHPSVPDTGHQEMFQSISGAWMVLCDPDRRTAYDKWLTSG
jgi:DnaJ-class molecular chaperone